MNYWRYILTVLIFLSATACSSNPKSIVEKHLEFIKSGNASNANQQYCVPSETLRLHTLKSFQVTDSQSKTRDGKSYTEVTAKVETDQYRLKKVDKDGVTVPERETLQQVTLEVWNSEDFYQRLLAETAKINDMANSTAALTGNPARTLPSPTREKVNKEGSCVFAPFAQFESES
jgi:hypothetical protein